MRLGKMIVKEIKQSMRDKQGLVMMMIFPLIMTVVLGFALSGMFESTSTPGNISALYCIEDKTEFGQIFTQFVPEYEKMNLKLVEEKDVEKAKKAVENAEYPCFVDVVDGRIDIYAREGNTYNASLVNAIMTGYARMYDANRTIYSYDANMAAKISQINVTGASYTQDVSLSRDRKPRAMDYYALTMLTLIVMYGALYGTGSVTDERRNKTLYRVFAAPAKNAEILVSKVSGNILALAAQIGFVFLIDKIFLNTYWGDNLLPVFIILLAQIIMVVSFGVAIGYLFKNSDGGIALIQTIIPVLAFLGGAYVNLEAIGVSGFLEKLTRLSPIRWINKTILQIVYARDYTDFFATVAICLGIAVVFLSLSAVFSRKELKA